MGRLARPFAPDGPIREFYDRLHELHAAAGEPSMRQLQRATRSQRRPNGINPTTIHAAFTTLRLARWEVVQEIVRQLDGDVEAFAEWWRRARQAQVTEPAHSGEASTPVPSGLARQVPRELPADVPEFTGRDGYLAELDATFDSGAETPTIATVTGPAGVGKTALAIRWARQARARFPDGELFVDLRGFAGGRRLRPVEVLAQFLRALGVPPDQIPVDEAAAAGRYRSALAGRRMLILLDDAAGPDQVRPLLPGSPGCPVLVTSRDRLTGLVARSGARRLTVDVLSEAESRTLLSRMLGAQRVVADPAAIGELAQACSHLPLALRIAAANLSNHPLRSVGEYVAELRQDGGLARLDTDDEETGVRRAFDLSYQAASPDGQQMFRLLGLVPAPDVTADAAAALAALPLAQTRQLLDRLAGAHLVYEHKPGRYGWHDLVHQYAAERTCHDDPAAARSAALGRWRAWYLRSAEAAATALYPHRLRLPVSASMSASSSPTEAHFSSRVEAVTWLDAELSNLVAVISHSAEHGARETAWTLANTLHGYFWRRMLLVDWLHAASTALAAAEADRNLPAQAAALLSLGNADIRQHHYQRAIDAFRRGVDLSEQAGWLDGQVSLLGSLAIAYREAGELELAITCFHRVLPACQQSGSRHFEAVALASLGNTYLVVGRLADAREYSQRALVVCRELGSRQAEAGILDDLGVVCRMQGEWDEAVAYLTEALAVARENRDRGNEANSLRNLAAVHCDAARLGEAMELGREASVLAGDLGDDRFLAAAHHTNAVIHHRLGRHREATADHRRALRLARATGDRYLEVEVLLDLAAVQHDLGRSGEAIKHCGLARDLAHQGGFGLLRRRAQAACDSFVER